MQDDKDIKLKVVEGVRASSDETGYALKFLEFADADLSAASVLLNQDEDYMYQGAYLATQSCEKYLKAFLVSRLSEQSKARVTEYTKRLGHDIQKIFNKCVVQESSINDILPMVEAIIPYEYLRYPDVVDEKIFNGGLSIGSGIVQHVDKVGQFVRPYVIGS